jgi:hypothetical protein
MLYRCKECGIAVVKLYRDEETGDNMAVCVMCGKDDLNNPNSFYWGEDDHEY